MTAARTARRRAAPSGDPALLREPTICDLVWSHVTNDRSKAEEMSFAFGDGMSGGSVAGKVTKSQIKLGKARQFSG
jgi:hypothetical protein